MRGEHDNASGRDFGELLDEHRALRPQVIDDEPVVHDLVPHVDRPAEFRECLFDDGDGAVDAGAEAARIGQEDFHDELFALPAGAPRRIRKLSMMSKAAPS